MKTLAEEIREALSKTPQEYIQEERSACAELVEAAGCLCWILEEADAAFRGEISEWGLDGGITTREIVQHDSRCPQALAAAILARGESR